MSSIRTRLLFVNDFNLYGKDSFGCCLQFQHSVYRDHSKTVAECGDILKLIFCDTAQPCMYTFMYVRTYVYTYICICILTKGVIDEAAGLKEKAQSLEEKLAEDDAYRHKLRKIIKQLKEDRNHYRSLAEQTR